MSTYLHFILTHSKGQAKFIHISMTNISSMMTDRANVAISIIQKVMYQLSIDIFTFDLDPL